ncbi:hypothetical protein CgunFtcFv8_019599 [Champsocephalus gunnari]|uniref:MHC class II beta chain N-terminal domain-containing protein n=1 Tax=Champsocephalus gunnari TaxID=52237 RepID=A0AAN8HNC1_CHAGU|nr:hypothetical protein CgunFtcFv8_019599 [Champsocephalus gunnari]
MGMKFSFSLLFLILFFSRADALFGHALLHCQFTSPDDFVYLGQMFFNKIHSYLEFTPVPGEKITCMVEHAHLMKPKLCEWDPRTDRESENNKIAVGTAGLLLGLVFFVAGLIYFKKKTYGRELVPTNSI